jgi:TolB protein
MRGRFGTPVQREVTRRWMLHNSVTAVLAATAAMSSGTGWAKILADGAGRVVKIALPDFVAASGELSDPARGITQVITADLQSSGRFTVIDPPAGGGLNVDTVPQLGAWRALGAEVLIIGRVKTRDARLQSEFRLWDVAAGQNLMGQQLSSAPENWRQVGHAISTAIYDRLTGEARDFEPHRD